jgi:hypothetical protein
MLTSFSILGLKAAYIVGRAVALAIFLNGEAFLSAADIISSRKIIA